MSLAVALTPFAAVFAQNTSSVTIVEVAILSSLIQFETLGQSQYNGTVGEGFDIQGTIYTSNGSYQILFGSMVVASGVANGFYVNATFEVPSLPDGGYDLAVSDVAIDINSTGTTPQTFTVLTGYYVNAVPSQAQEGGSVA